MLKAADMPEVKEVLRVLRLLKKSQPVYAWGLASQVGDPKARIVWAWRWLHYLQDLELVEKVSDDGRPTSRKMYVLTEKGENFHTVLEEIFARQPMAAIDMYAYRSRRTS